jgi:urea transporter
VRTWTIGNRAIATANRRASARARCVARLGKNTLMAQRLRVLAGSGLREKKMDALLVSWERLCSASGVLRFVDINLRGIGQVMLQNNPLTGALFLAAIAWGAFVAGAPEVLFGGMLALITSTFAAMWLRVDRQALGDGLYGYNAVLVGLALPTFLEPSPTLWGYVVLGGAVSVVAMLATANLIRTWQLSSLTFPFVIVTWALLLAAFAFAGVGGGVPPYAGEVALLDPAASNPLDMAAFLAGVYNGISQVFLKASLVSALLFVAGLAVSSVAAAVFAVAAAVLSVTTAHLLGAQSDLVSAGLLGFSPVLTAITLGTVFYEPSPRVALYAALGTVFTVVAQAAMNVAFAPLGIPALTAPFVLTSWLFLLPRQHLGASSETRG